MSLKITLGLRVMDSMTPRFGVKKLVFYHGIHPISSEFPAAALGWWMAASELGTALVITEKNRGFHGVYPNSWMVYFMENPTKMWYQYVFPLKHCNIV